MTSNKQDSSVIRISQKKRDASARATHLEAVTRKFLVSTNERKQMSTKTNFKRIALVAVAAVGMGLLSSVPSQAAFSGTAGSNITITTTNGTGSISKSDSTTAGTVRVRALALGTNVDSLSVTNVISSLPSAATQTHRLIMQVIDTASSTAANGFNPMSLNAASTPVVFTPQPYVAGRNQLLDSGTAFGLTAITAGYLDLNMHVFLESATARATTGGDYVYTIVATPYTSGAAGTAVTANVTISVTAAASTSVTIAPGSSTAFIGTGTTPTEDASISALSTASATAAAYVRVRTFNANGDLKPESITATISGAGVLAYGGVTGASLTGVGDADGDTNIEVRPNGTAGVATITISTTSRTFPAKTMTFYAEAPKTLVASVSAPNANVGTNSDVVRVTATDSAGANWAGTLYIYASSATDAAVAGAVRATAAASAISCTAPTATQPAHVCPVTGSAAGTAKFKVSNYATAALATAAASGAEVTSNEVTVTVNANAIATVKLEFDKATYAPGERARIYVTPLDSAGKAVGANTYANLLAAGGISTASSVTFAGSTTTADSLTAVSITTKAVSSSTSGAKAGSFEYTVYMPVSGGTVTISATGGTSLPIAGRVAVTASATVTDSGAAALAAVNALATTVASLRTLITTLTNLVLKIQKKVKA